MEQTRTNAGQTLGIIGLILAILSLFLAFIPCVGFIAIAPAVIAIVLSAVGLSQASKNNGAKGLNIGALIVSVVSVLFASVWLILVVGLSTIENEDIEDIVEEVIEGVIESHPANQDLQDALEELEDQLDKIKIDSIEIKGDSIDVKVKIEVETKEE